MTQKTGGVVLLGKEHLDMENPWGKPVIGWQPNSQGLDGRHNPMGFGLMWVVVQKQMDDVMKSIYNQPMIVENPGAIVIATLGDRVGLVRNFRMVGPRLMPDAGADYIKRLDAEQRWDELTKTLGRWSWEAPRGLAPVHMEGEDLTAFIIRTAKLEAREEAGFRLKNVKRMGEVNVNSTFFPHAQHVVHAEIESIGDAKPEALEILGERQLFTREELRQLNINGEFDDGLTLAAMALCGLSL